MKKTLINSQLNNVATYLKYRRQLLSLAENVFQFINLPDFIYVPYFNKTLLQQGSIAFFKDDVLGVIALPYSVLGNLDIYGRPKTIMARAFNGQYFRKLNQDEFIIMYDNNSLNPIYLDICQSAERLAHIKRTIDINIAQQRTPRVWKTSKDKENTLKAILNNIDGMQEKIVTYNSLNIEDLNAVLQPAPFVSDKLREEFKEELNEFFRLVGIASLNEQKQERLIVDEINVSQGGTIASRFSRFDPRKKACEQINKKWGLNLEVKFYDGEPDSRIADNIANQNENNDNFIIEESEVE